MGQVPILDIDDKQYHQSKSIGRFIAKKGNLYGSDEFEAMEIDATVDSIEDMRQRKNASGQQSRDKSLITSLPK